MNYSDVMQLKRVLEKVGSTPNDLSWVVARNLILCERKEEHIKKDAEKLKKQFVISEGEGAKKKPVFWCYISSYGKDKIGYEPYQNDKGEFEKWDSEKKYPNNIIKMDIDPARFQEYLSLHRKLYTEDLEEIKWYMADDEVIMEMLYTKQLSAVDAAKLSGTIIRKSLLEDDLTDKKKPVK